MEHDAVIPQPADAAAATSSIEVEEELLVEEISIDGMCGVY
jgi:mycofactocin precursor